MKKVLSNWIVKYIFREICLAIYFLSQNCMQLSENRWKWVWQNQEYYEQVGCLKKEWKCDIYKAKEYLA